VNEQFSDLIFTKLPTLPPRTLSAAPAPDGNATKAPAHRRRISPLYLILKEKFFKFYF